MVTYIKSDLQFILDQIIISERHAAGESLSDILPNSEVPFGLRTVDGTLNNLVPGQENFGSADQEFPHLVDPVYNNDGDEAPFPSGPPPAPLITNTDYAQGGTSLSGGNVVDSDPRIISNLIVDQTANNPAAVDAAANNGAAQLVISPGLDGIFGTIDDREVYLIPNTAPDEGLSAPFNSWFTLFGQFFDHGLDLVGKGGNGTVIIPLQADDPLVAGADGTFGTLDDLPPNLRFLTLTRATADAGADGILGTADDGQGPTNSTTPFVDQNQTYTSHSSHQVFLRAYEFNAQGRPVATGELIVDRDIGADETFGTIDDVEIGGMATWATVKAQARDLLGIELTDHDVVNVPLLRTDQYGNFIPGPNGFAQVIVSAGTDGILNTSDDVVVEGDPDNPVNLLDVFGDGSNVQAQRTGHAFMDDIAHTANPFNSRTGLALTADADDVAGGPVAAGQYDDELLDAHYMAGDGRANENIGLTAVHHVFHAEHNRLVGHTKEVAVQSAIDTNDLAFLNSWLDPDNQLTELPLDASQATLDSLIWNGERLFQAAKFGTEMQYQHLVFEEFARKVQPLVDIFIAYDSTIDASILAEFAHTVYRFGHSMLNETVDRLDANFVPDDIGLIAAFLNPLEFAASGATPEEAAGAIVRGMTRQVGNEIDEFVTEALRNNLLGLPLDLATINLARGRDTGVPTLNAARRDFYEHTGDAQLKPYTSWVDFAGHVKHESSVINFIAAYGTHVSITNAATLEDKRTAAMELVFGVDLNGDLAVASDRLNFLNSTGAYANLANGVTTTGVDAIDLWIGGLAERQMPFGGLLGSTFNFVFETQMESLQSGDRFYYLARTAGLNFLSELENNSFAKMIMRNTDTTHLPGDVFSTPAFILEVDQSRQFTGLGVNGNDDPIGDSIFTPLVIRDNPATVVSDTNYLRYTGVDHVVLGGTEGDDILIASIGDDTVWGDGGNDRIEGGDGVDMLVGGAGNDIITDLGGDDNLQGGDGDDVLHAGNGFNLLIGGAGNDVIITGEDTSEVFAGTGNDFILGAPTNEVMQGNDGDDWIEIGTADGATGDNFDPFGLDNVAGNDVFLGNGGIDEFIGEGGDDISVGGPGPDRHEGLSGFDWATFKDDEFGVTVDMNVAAFDETPIPPSNAAVLDRFGQVEGLSGSRHADILIGDDADAVEIANAGAQGSVLTNIALIDGLQELLGAGVTSFGSGNIILGGDGSDFIEGRGGDDIIDGDSWLNVRIRISDAGGNEVDTVDSLTGLLHNTALGWEGRQLTALLLSGEITPGQLSIVREIINDNNGPDFDTAVFTDVLANYIIEGDGEDIDSDGFITVSHIDPNDGTVLADGIDRLKNIERLEFSDQSVTLVEGLNNDPLGQLTLSDTTPFVGQTLTVTAENIFDADNAPPGTINGPIAYFWQVEQNPGAGDFIDIVVPNIGGEEARASGPTFTVTADLAGLAIRVRGLYQDDHGVLERVLSATTDLVALTDPGPGVNTPPELTIAPAIDVAEGSLIFAVANATDAETPLNLTFSLLGPDSGLLSIDPDTGLISFNTAPDFENPADAGGNNVYDISVRVTDAGGLTATTAVAVTVTNVNEAPTGTVSIDDVTPAQGQTLTASNTLADPDSPGVAAGGLAVSYQWETSTNGVTWTPIGGATGATFTPGQAQVGLQLRVAATYTDGGAFTNTVNSAATAAVQDVNDPTTGGVLIVSVTASGTSATLNGSNTIGDLDGVSGLVAFQWQQQVGGTFQNIAGANAATLVGVSGGTFRLTSTYSDPFGSYTLVSSKTAVVGSDGANTIVANGGRQFVLGLNGNDTLTGSAGDDTVSGGGGADTLRATIGDGNDEYDGGAGIDTYTLATTSAASTVDLAAGTASSAQTGSDLLSGIENVIGSSGADNIGGNGIANVLTGLAGDDTISGEGGNDTIRGGEGNDTLDGGDGDDFLGGLDGDDNLMGGDGDDDLRGQNGNDTLSGGIGSDILIGGAGVDVLNGGAGDDQMNGGAGTDTIVLEPGFGNDTVAGFDANPAGGQDLIDVSGLGITADLFATAISISGVGVTTIEVGGGTITLLAVNSANVDETDFIFAP
ncbi:MAG: peroxidase family protein [Hyphomicrobium sp.]